MPILNVILNADLQVHILSGMSVPRMLEL
jgi:hypothetical protein